MGAIKRRIDRDQDQGLAAVRLGELVDQGLDVFCWCHRCGHHAVVPARGLVARLGPGFPVPEVGGRLRCSSCGTRDVATRPHWPTRAPVARAP